MLMMTLASTSFCKKDQQILIVLKSDGEAVESVLIHSLKQKWKKLEIYSWHVLFSSQFIIERYVFHWKY